MNTSDALDKFLGAPLVNTCQSLYDDYVKANAEFRSSAGMKAKIIRTTDGHCCEWCSKLAGVYEYHTEPKDVYRRHDNCGCQVTYVCEKGAQDVHSKQYLSQSEIDERAKRKSVGITSEAEEKAKVEERKEFNFADHFSQRQAKELQEKFDKSEITYNKVNKLSSQINEAQIIEKVSGGDRTKGSCASSAFAYIGNKGGLDVRDFRGGESTAIFARNENLVSISNLPGVKSFRDKNTNQHIGARDIMSNMQDNKEYLLVTGRHAAMVKKVDGKNYYLELQSPFENGWKEFTDNTLETRFHCQNQDYASFLHTNNTTILIDSKTLYNNDEFNYLLGYLNTTEKKERKSMYGSIK